TVPKVLPQLVHDPPFLRRDELNVSLRTAVLDLGENESLAFQGPGVRAIPRAVPLTQHERVARYGEAPVHRRQVPGPAAAVARQDRRRAEVRPVDRGRARGRGG